MFSLRAADWLAFLVLALASGMSASCEGGEGGGPPPSTPASAQAAEVVRTGWPLELTNDLGQRFRLIPAATFQMGSPEGEPYRAEDEPLHEVKLVRPYYLQTPAVTNAQYRRFRPDHTRGEGLDGDEQPVVNVTWHDAVAYAAWLAEEDPRVVYRLPTEAEWEHAARAGGGEPLATWRRCEEGAPTPRVGTGGANAWGLYDVMGGVGEWCHDRYGPYPSWLQQNPQGAATGNDRVVRGEGLRVAPDPGGVRTRVAGRGCRPSADASPAVGFRLAFGLSYGRCEHGRYPVEVQTIDPTVEEGEDRVRPGWPMYMISVVDRLTDRVNQLVDPRWTRLEQRSPLTLHLAPGIYYDYAYRMEGERKVRSIERKFAVPGPDVIECPIPRKYQANPQ